MARTIAPPGLQCGMVGLDASLCDFDRIVTLIMASYPNVSLTLSRKLIFCGWFILFSHGDSLSNHCPIFPFFLAMVGKWLSYLSYN